MNDTLALAHRHRSIRRYASDAIPDDHVQAAVRAGQSASTSSAVQAYCLIRVRDPRRRQTLVELTGGQPMVANCGAFFVVCGDTRRHRLACDRAGHAYRARLEAFVLAVVDASLFAQNLVLAFESMGYGICYVGGLRNRIDEVDRLLELPPGVLPLYGLCVGVPDETPSARPRLPLNAVLMDERYAGDDEMLGAIDEYDVAYQAYMRERGVEPERIRGWAAIMAEKFSEPRRTHLGPYYRAKGADLD